MSQSALVRIPQAGLAPAQPREVEVVVVPAPSPFSVYVPPAVRREDDPHVLAAAFLERCCRDEMQRLRLRRWRDEWWAYENNVYRPISDEELLAHLGPFVRAELDRKRVVDRYDRLLPVTNGLRNNVVKAVIDGAIVDGRLEQPMGLGQLNGATGYIALANGLLDIGSKGREAA